MSSEGVCPSDIDTVIITHAHWDHVGACIDTQGNCVFPDARFVLNQKDWDYWIMTLNPATVEERKKRSTFAARRNLIPLKEHLELIQEDKEIVPGVKMVMAPGHTPGHTLVEISSRGKRMLCIADLIHHPLEFARPRAYSIWDVLPGEAVRIRNRFFSQVVKSSTLIFSYHFPFPGLGHIVRKGSDFSWQPTQTID